VLPDVNTLLRVAVGKTDNHADGMRALDAASRVEDIETIWVTQSGRRRQRVRLLVAAPSYAGDAERPRPGTACTVTWTTPNGLMDLPVAFEEVAVDGRNGLRLWWLTAAGEPSRVQRRTYFRCSCAFPIMVEITPTALAPDEQPGIGESAPDPADGGDQTQDAPPPPILVRGRTVNLSEGGVRCYLHGKLIEIGSHVSVRLDLIVGERMQTVTLGGRVLRCGLALGSPPPMDCAVAFDDPDEHGDLIRQALFSEQLRQRRMGV